MSNSAWPEIVPGELSSDMSVPADVFHIVLLSSEGRDGYHSVHDAFLWHYGSIQKALLGGI